MTNLKPKTKLEKLKTEFLEYLEIEKNRSPLTLRDYDLYLKRFVEFAAKSKIKNPSAITLDLVRNFRIMLNRRAPSDRPLKLVTQAYHIIALRSFLKYLARRDIKSLAAEKLELPKTPSRQVEFLETDDLEKLLAAPAKEKKELTRLRDKAILELLFSTGLRVGELANLKRRQISFKKDEFSVRGKGDKIRLVFTSLAARTALEKYLACRKDNSEALFIRHNHPQTIDDHSPLTPRSVQRIIKKYARLSGISARKITPHTLRHTMATDLLANGADIRSVQEILGHASITTTQIYTHITSKRLKEIHRRYHGRFRKTRVSS